MEGTLDKIPFVEGLKDVFGVLRKYGTKIAILSTGFSYLGERIKEKVGLNEIKVYANDLLYDKFNRFKGVRISVSDDPGSKRSKRNLVREICNEMKTSPVNTAAIGDSHSDKEMFESIGISILFTDKVMEDIKTDYHVKDGDLTSILKYLFR